MLSLTAIGSYLGFMKHQTLNELQGVLTFYLGGNAWLPSRRGDGEAAFSIWVLLWCHWQSLASRFMVSKRPIA
jgi:hypothetical protein